MLTSGQGPSWLKGGKTLVGAGKKPQEDAEKSKNDKDKDEQKTK